MSEMEKMIDSLREDLKAKVKAKSKAISEMEKLINSLRAEIKAKSSHMLKVMEANKLLAMENQELKARNNTLVRQLDDQSRWPAVDPCLVHRYDYKKP